MRGLLATIKNLLARGTGSESSLDIRLWLS
jgi:hypothetical protein